MIWLSKKHAGNPYEVLFEYDVEKQLSKNGLSLVLLERHFGKKNKPYYTASPPDCVQMVNTKKKEP